MDLYKLHFQLVIATSVLYLPFILYQYNALTYISSCVTPHSRPYLPLLTTVFIILQIAHLLPLLKYEWH